MSKGYLQKGSCLAICFFILILADDTFWLIG